MTAFTEVSPTTHDHIPRFGHEARCIDIPHFNCQQGNDDPRGWIFPPYHVENILQSEVQDSRCLVEVWPTVSPPQNHTS
jgi:hypothetical protein